MGIQLPRPTERGRAPATFRVMAKRSPISATAELLLSQRHETDRRTDGQTDGWTAASLNAVARCGVGERVEVVLYDVPRWRHLRETA